MATTPVDFLDRGHAGTAGVVGTSTERRLVGGSDATRALRARVKEITAAGVAGVLIVGERGTGKAAVARALHAIGDRRDRPLVEVDCAAADDDDDALSAVTVAAAGTLLLREVAATGAAAQAAILRAAASGVRLLATTVHDLSRLCDEGGFDADLLGRLTAATIDVRPLRERPDDVPDLARHFTAIAARRERRPALEPELAAVNLMQGYAWPRNVRELRNFVDRAYQVSGPGNPLRAGLIQPWLQIGSVDPLAGTVEALAGQPLADIEKRVILSTLQQFRGHRIKTAGALGIGVRTLGMKLKRWRDEGEPVEPAARAVG
jgi:two-component system response regulator HydG